MLPEACTLVIVVLGAFLAYGPYHDDRTWNLVRNSADLRQIDLDQESHFGLYALTSRAKPKVSAASLLFVPGHGGSWKQGINLCVYLEEPVHFYALDFHASASALHWSVLKSQALYTSAALDRIKGLHPGPHLVLGHSMGGLVALEALRTRSVDALVLISTPVESHPLLLDPRFAQVPPLSVPKVYSLSGGATDPLVPMHSSRILGRVLPLPAARDVYASFSHVNLLFSRHSLHFLSRLLRGEDVAQFAWQGQAGQDGNVSSLDPVELKSVGHFPGGFGLTFSLLLLEESRPPKRRPETTSRGETFDAGDRLNCSQAVELLWREKEDWMRASATEMQFPAKACLYHVRRGALAANLTKLRLKGRTGWAQWQADPWQAALDCSSLSWLIFQPMTCKLPAGRPLITRIVLPEELPLDLRLREVSPTKARSVPLLLAAVSEREEDLRIAALPLAPAPASRLPGWDSETDPKIFAPRFVEGSRNVSILVMGHPDLEIILEVRPNPFALLAELLRHQSYGSWLGAIGAASASDLDGTRCWMWMATWLLASCAWDWTTQVRQPLTFLDRLLGLGLALLSRWLGRFLSRRARSGRPKTAVVLFLFLLLLASIQPAGCMLLLAILAIGRHEMLGMSSLLLGPYLLCHVPALIFAVWLLLGQDREASAPFLQSSFQRSYPSSQHRPSLWADSWLLEHRPGLEPGPTQALGLVAPSVAVCCSIARGGSMRSRWAAALLLCLSAVATVTTRASSLWWSCQPLLILHAILALLQVAFAKAKDA